MAHKCNPWNSTCVRCPICARRAANTTAAMLSGTRGYTVIAEWAGRLTQAQLRRLRARYNPTTPASANGIRFVVIDL